MAQSKSMTLVSFLASQGVTEAPQPVICKQDGIAHHMGYAFRDMYGDTKWLNQPKNHPGNLSLVNFNQPLNEEGRVRLQDQVATNFSKLSVIISHKETAPGVYDGDECYTLIDTDKLNAGNIENAALMAAVNAANAAKVGKVDNAPF